MTAGLIGWFICSLFASVGYSWTFYYLLALIVDDRRDRAPATGAAGLKAACETPSSNGAPRSNGAA